MSPLGAMHDCDQGDEDDGTIRKLAMRDGVDWRDARAFNHWFYSVRAGVVLYDPDGPGFGAGRGTRLFATDGPIWP